MSKIDELKSQLAIAEAKEQNKTMNIKIELNKHCIGKAYKNISTSNYSTYIDYVMVLDFVRYSDGKIMYREDNDYLVADNLSISYTIDGYHLDNGILKYSGSNKRTHLPLKKHYEKGVAIEANSRNFMGSFRPSQLNKDGNVYADRNWYQECPVQEFIEVKEKILAENRTTRENFKQYNTKKEYPTNLIDVSPLDIKLLQALFQKVEKKQIDLNSYITIAKKTSDFIEFDNNQLKELTQYCTTGDRGVNNNIESGDDGTDYEPYTTKYVLCSVNIDWKKVLYTIRTKLDSVVKTAEELEKLSAVYDTDNWNVSYYGTYDVSFDSCTLYNNVLQEVNKIIKKHLK